MREIARTGQVARHPWPEDVFLQGGARGVVFQRGRDAKYYTAFVEAFPPRTFLRGEGATVAEAEDKCWEKYQRLADCPAHPDHGPFDARGYTNGAGFCTRCGSWFSDVLPKQPERARRHPSILERALADPEVARGVLADLTEGESDA